MPPPYPHPRLRAAHLLQPCPRVPGLQNLHRTHEKSNLSPKTTPSRPLQDRPNTRRLVLRTILSQGSLVQLQDTQGAFHQPPPDRQDRPQEWPRTAHRGPKNELRPHTQDSQLHDRPCIENVEEKYQRKNMLPVNFTIDHPSKI